jgi:DNA-binding protein YbaB
MYMRTCVMSKDDQDFSSLFPNKTDLASLFDTAGQVQQIMTGAHDKLKQAEIVIEVGGKLVRIDFRGDYHVAKVTIDASLCQNDEAKLLLEELLKQAFNQGGAKIKTRAESIMAEAASQVKLPANLLGRFQGDNKSDDDDDR